MSDIPEQTTSDLNKTSTDSTTGGPSCVDDTWIQGDSIGGSTINVANDAPASRSGGSGGPSTLGDVTPGRPDVSTSPSEPGRPAEKESRESEPTTITLHTCPEEGSPLRNHPGYNVFFPDTHRDAGCTDRRRGA